MFFLLFLFFVLLSLCYIFYPIIIEPNLYYNNIVYSYLFKHDINRYQKEEINGHIEVIKNAIKDLDLEKKLGKISIDEYNILLQESLEIWESYNLQLKGL